MLPMLADKGAPDPRVRRSPAVAAVRSAAPFLPGPVITTWSEQPLLVADAKSAESAWLLAPAERDPLHTGSGGLPIPAGPLRELARIAATGVHFDRIAIAHELPRSHEVASLATALPATGLACSDAAAAKLVGVVPAPVKSIALATWMDAAAATVSVSAVRAAASAIAFVLPATVDPIIFGVVGLDGPPKDGAPAAYFPLVAWDW